MEPESRRTAGIRAPRALALVLRYVDEARLSDGWKHFVRLALPLSEILLLCFVDAAILAGGLG